MGSSGFDSKEKGNKSKVESISLTKIFEELCPIYMGYGMSYDEYWYGDVYRAKFYREAYEIQMKHKDEEFWIQGMYIYDALCRVSPVLHAFSKSGTKPLPYPKEPYLAKSIDGSETEEEKQKRIENERLIARVYFENWARETAKKFNNEKNNK